MLVCTQESSGNIEMIGMTEKCWFYKRLTSLLFEFCLKCFSEKKEFRWTTPVQIWLKTFRWIWNAWFSHTFETALLCIALQLFIRLECQNREYLHVFTFRMASCNSNGLMVLLTNIDENKQHHAFSSNSENRMGE